LNENLWVSGEWTGFYLEPHHDRRGWMHLYLEFQSPVRDRGVVRGEGTDYVGPWNLSGIYLPADNKVTWDKRYVGRHIVHYQGVGGQNGVTGQWSIGGYLGGQFHIWPRSWGQIDELYMADDLGKDRDQGISPGIFSGSGGVMEPAFDLEPRKPKGFRGLCGQ